MKYTKGSEWRKWDLHIHSPSTVMNNEFYGKSIEDKWEKYVYEIEKLRDVSVLGITDYFSIEGYKKMKQFKKDGRLKNINLLLPNVEFRLSTSTGKDKAINYHVIFSPEIVDELDHLFFDNLKCTYGGETYPCNRKGLIRLGKDYYSSGIKKEDEAYYNKGVEQFKVNVDDIMSILESNSKLLNGSITGVANSSNDGASGLQNEDAFEVFRSGLYKQADVIFSATPSDIEYFTGKKTSIEEVESNCGGVKPCIHGSDAHSLEKICKPDKNRYTWIKADPTFLGLKQVLYEPEDRVYIGEIPPLLKKVKEEPENYLKSITIGHEEDYESEYGVWFDDLTIQLNDGLIAIIGNKGKGKSAIADIIGLLGNSRNYEHSSFLNKEKFKKEKGKLAKNFKATLNINKFERIEKNLNEEEDKDDIDIVKYIPQSFFEEVTNDLDEKFGEEIENVIYSHIDSNDRICNNFNDFIKEKTRATKENIEEVLIDLKFINKKIINLESKRNKNYKEKIENKLNNKKQLLNSLEEPKKIDPPTKSKQDKDKEAELEDLNYELAKVRDIINKKQSEIKDLKTKKMNLNIFKDRLESLDGYIKKVIDDNKDICESAKLNVEEIINYDMKHDIVINRLEEFNKNIKTIENELLICTEDNLEIDGIDKSKLYYLKTAIENKIECMTKDLDEPNKKYQDYIKAYSLWEFKKESIIGSKDTIDTMKYYENELKYIEEDLDKDIEKAKNERSNKCEMIFNEKEKEIKIYNQIKKTIDQFIKDNDHGLEEFKVSLNSGYKLKRNFYENSINYIDKTKKGSFRGDDKELIKEIFEGEIKTFEDISTRLKNIIEHLENDYRNESSPEKREISSQIKEGKINDFYNYIYSLDYLEPSYSLKLDDKNLEELSPGEKGALLLVFYLLLDKSSKPLIIDQPEDNLDNQSVFNILVPFIKKAKNNRQIIMVTHNPNLAVVADAEQIVHVDMDKSNGNKVSLVCGSIENPNINEKIVEILEGTMPAFNKRNLKYIR